MKIFEIVDGKVVLNENILLIPDLKACYDKYTNDGEDLSCFTYCHYMTHPESPYTYEDELTKSETIYEIYKGNYKPVDKEIVDAIDWLNARYVNTSRKFYLANKKAVEKLSAYLSSVILDDSKDTGNITHVMKLVSTCGKVMDEFEKLEKKQLEKTKARTNAKIAYDLM